MDQLASNGMSLGNASLRIRIANVRLHARTTSMENANEIILLMRDKNKRQIARERTRAGRINRDDDAFRIFLLAESVALVWNTSIYGTPGRV